MGLYNFQPRFADAIRAGAKTHTIRAPRKGGREDKPGDTMHLYTGLRHKGAERLLNPPPVCSLVESIVVAAVGASSKPDVFVGPFLPGVLDDEDARARVSRRPREYGLERLDVHEVETLARRDGFADFADMMAFWDGRLPFYGHIFHWRARKAGK